VIVSNAGDGELFPDMVIELATRLGDFLVEKGEKESGLTLYRIALDVKPGDMELQSKVAEMRGQN
jgi:hypothetical protein